MRQAARRPGVRELAGGLAWSVGAVAAERAVGLAQALLVARLLGIEDFGRYGLVFATIGLLASLAGLQLGMTATVEIARSSRTAPRRAAAVGGLCEIASLALGALCLSVTIAAPAEAARLLLGDAQLSEIVVAAGVIAGLSVFSGVQEGILQGLERFRELALLRIVAAALGLALILLLARPGDLGSVIQALVLGAVLRSAMIAVAKARAARAAGLQSGWGGAWHARNLILSFSLPAMLASLCSGGVVWLGNVLVSRLPDGLAGVAVLTAAQQWRGVVLHLATISASVAIPLMSRLAGSGDAAGVRRIHRANLLISVAAAAGLIAGLGIVSGPVLGIYGRDFVDGRAAFWLMAATAVPSVHANIYFQLLVSQGRLWRQLGYHVAQSLALLVGYAVLIPRHGALGLAMWTLVVGSVASVVLALTETVAPAAARTDAPVA